jgi:hypothetical protein
VKVAGFSVTTFSAIVQYDWFLRGHGCGENDLGYVANA